MSNLANFGDDIDHVSESTPLVEIKHESKPKKKFLTKKSLYLTVLVVGLFLMGTINSVVSKKMFDAYTEKHAYFAGQMNNLNYLILALLVIFYKMIFTKDITPEMRRFPHYKFVIMAFLDGLGTFLSSIGSVYTPGQFQTLLSQSLIPVTCVLAFFILKTRYKYGEVGGATLVFIGACIAVIPSIIHPEKAVAQFKWNAALLFFLSNIPMASSSVYKELGFKNAILDCYFLTFWVSLYQFFIGFLFAPLQGLHGFGGIPVKEIPSQFWDGCQCFVGISNDPSIDCTYNGLWLVGYSLINFVYNVLGLILTKEGSEVGLGAVLCTVAYAIKVPLTNLAFTLKFIMGDEVEKFTFYSVLGLVVVLVGFVWFFISNQTGPSASSSTEGQTKPLLSSKGHSSEESDEDFEQPDTPFQSPNLFCGIPIKKGPTCDCQQPWGFHERVVGVVSTNTIHHHADCPLKEQE